MPNDITNKASGSASLYITFSNYSPSQWHTIKSVITDSLGHTSSITMQFFTYIPSPPGGGCNPFCSPTT